MNCRMLLALVSTMDSITSFPAAIQDGDHNRFLVHVHSDILDVVTHLSCLLGGKLIRANACLSLKVKCHSPADLPMLSCSPFAPDTLLQLLSAPP